MLPDDDPTIPDRERLLRRVPPNLMIWNENTAAWEASTGAFSNSSDGSGMSVSLSGGLRAEGLSDEEALRGYEGFGLVAITAGLARAQDQGVIRNPTTSDAAHAEVVGRKTKRVKKAFKRNAVWVVGPVPSKPGDE